jgi:hypothetical protein
MSFLHRQFRPKGGCTCRRSGVSRNAGQGSATDPRQQRRRRVLQDAMSFMPPFRSRPDPLLVLEMENGQVISAAPEHLEAPQRAPEWTRPILEAALRGGPGHD